MCTCTSHSHGCADARLPFHCIVPPHMLEVLSMRGDEKVARAAREQMAIAAEARVERKEYSSLRMVPDGGAAVASFVTPTALAAGRNLRREVYDGQQKAALPGKLARAEGDPPKSRVPGADAILPARAEDRENRCQRNQQGPGDHGGEVGG